MGISKNLSESKRQIYASLSMLLDVRPEDAMSVIKSSRAGALINSANAIILVLSTWNHHNWIFLLCWMAVAILTFLYIADRSRKASQYKPKHVSRRAIKKLVLLTGLFGLPWAVITYPTLGPGELKNSLLVSMMCAGLASGGAMMLYRVPLAAFAYMGVILLGVCITIILEQFYNLWPMIIYSIGYVIVLVAAVIFSWQIARAKDDNLLQATNANEELKNAYNEIRQMSMIDPLTGLLNRKAFIDRLIQYADRDKQKSFAVFLMDLDRFKNINDSIGHGAGDTLLKIIASRLQNSLPASDIIARFGGDEFAMIIELDSPKENAPAVATRILERLNKSVSIEHAIINPNASIGIALYPEHSENADDFISLADIALHHAKDEGRGRYKLYTKDMADALARADRIEQILRDALTHNKIQIYYQPKIELSSGRIFGAEALLRCFDENNKIISTEEVLDIAEERGMILQISDFIFDRVTTDILNWRKLNLPHIQVAINVHDYDLKTSDWLLKQLQKMFKAGIEQNDILLEVTEGCFVGRGSDAATATLDMIDEMGVKLSLDDFGTGHAALSHLKRLPVSELKVDREFIRGICSDHRDKAITLAAVELARYLGIVCVAEGIENSEQADMLATLEQDGTSIIGQGHYWASPMKNDEFIHFIQTWHEKTDLSLHG